MSEMETIANSTAPDIEDWIGLANFVYRHDVQQAVCLQALDKARVLYAGCLVMQSTRPAANECEWKAPDSIGSFSAAADRLATELRNLTKAHKDMPITYELFPPQDADEVLQQLHDRTQELFVVESRFLDSVLTTMNLFICSLVPQDDWNSYLVEAPDKQNIKNLMESDTTMNIGRATKHASATCTNIKDWIRSFLLFCFLYL